MTVGGVVLAAGFSRRLGRPKQDLEIGGVSLLERTVRTACEAELSPLIVVVREAAWLEKLTHLPVQVCLNAEADEGMASSIRVGVKALLQSDVRGAVLLTCDQPLLSVAHLGKLRRQSEHVVGSAYGERVGVPAYFPVEVFPQLVRLRGDVGARALLQGALSVPNEDLALDVDTEADARRAEEVLRSRNAQGTFLL